MQGSNFFICPKCQGKIVVGAEFCTFCAFDLSLINVKDLTIATDETQSTEFNLGYKTATSVSQSSNKTLLGFAVVFGTLILVTIVIALGISWSGGRIDPASSIGFSSDQAGSDHRIGKTGRLVTNLRLRSSSNKNASVLGVHYRNAKVKILTVEAYETADGYSTWFNVQVLEDGCDAEGKLGCGHEGGRVGWMNSKYITLDK